ncbi:hypothetical protein Acr_07g0009900 [Actinidia rufa]|uniref:Uncharacterized protein n=1 Tax=Actinidia rufa TaxID=165716 RepID=A0A7J0EWL4_9ERIC|nr:hypothetical protein Acr_07g0009900 [Actinidia rufa]
MKLRLQWKWEWRLWNNRDMTRAGMKLPAVGEVRSITFGTACMAGKVGICVLGKGGNVVGIDKVGGVFGSVGKRVVGNGGNGEALGNVGIADFGRKRIAGCVCNRGGLP